MDFSRYRVILTIRILVLVISAILLAFTIVHTGYIMVSGLITVIIIYQTYALFHFSDKTNRELVRFFQAIENADFTQSSSIQNFGASFRDLAQSFARAGHLPIVHFQNEQNRCYLLTPAGIGVGLESGTVFNKNLTMQSVDLKKGDWFIFYTNGLTESMNANQEEFGDQRLIDCIMENRQQEAQSMNENILQSIKDFSGKTIQQDDMTIVSIKVLQ